jgi:hypothetical protein
MLTPWREECKAFDRKALVGALSGAYYARLKTGPSDKAHTHASAGLRDFLR